MAKGHGQHIIAVRLIIYFENTLLADRLPNLPSEFWIFLVGAALTYYDLAKSSLIQKKTG